MDSDSDSDEPWRICPDRNALISPDNVAELRILANDCEATIGGEGGIRTLETVARLPV